MAVNVLIKVKIDWLTLLWKRPLYAERIKRQPSIHRACIVQRLYVLHQTEHYICWAKVKVKLSLYRPGQALSVPGVEASRISRQSALENGMVVSPMHRPPLPPADIPRTRLY